MKRLTIAFSVILLVAGATFARPRGGPRPPHPPPPVWHGGHYRPPSWGWGVHVTPWGTSFGVGTRVGRHGSFGFSVPLVPTPVVRKTTVVVQQPTVVQPQPVVVQPTVVQPVVTPERTPGILPAYVPKPDDKATAKTWVEGYWKVVRDPEGKETSRTWVPGHWEE